MAQETPSRYLDKIVVRLPDGLRKRIKAAAEANKRSVNQELVVTLLEYYPEPDPPDPQELVASLRQLMDDLLQMRKVHGAAPDEVKTIRKAAEKLDDAVKSMNNVHSDNSVVSDEQWNSYVRAQVEVIEALMGEPIAGAEEVKKQLQSTTERS